ncbi:adenosylmethionine decarboxylase, partial [Burkholderia sp. Ap-962]|nr:adenosylmethionine decarboxylase [Burkholderia sp. Ap-962]NIF93556.1 adenosylmethionine decarboxylase [Burkholderia sp. Cy-637]
MRPVSTPAQGSHVLADLDGIEPARLRDAARLEAILTAAARAA